MLRTPTGGAVKVVERGSGTPVVFLHSGVGSAGEWREAFALWPQGYRLIAVDAYRESRGLSAPSERSLADYADQVLAVTGEVGEPVHLVGFSWGGATGLYLAATQPEVLASLAVVEPEAYSLLGPDQPQALAQITALRNDCQAHIRAGRWYAAYEQFVDFYNGPGSFALWPADRRDVFLERQRERGDLWHVLFDAPLTTATLQATTVPVHVVEGSRTDLVDHTICELILQHVPQVEHSIIDGAGHMMPLTHAAPLTQALSAGIAGLGKSDAQR